MANMSFGVNLLPKTNNTYSLGNSDYKWNIFVNTINGAALSNIILPAVTSTDNGKILGVDNGAWAAITAPTTDISTKADKTNTILINSLTMGTRQEGYATGTNSIALGTNNRATATSSFVNGENSLSTGPAAMAVGYYCEATNYGSNALGVSAKAYGFAAHADGNDTQAYGDYSSVSGRGTLLYGRASHIFGEYNIDSNGSSTAAGDRGTYVEIVGNGTSGSARSNARMLTWAGTEYLGGDLYVNCGSDGTNGSKVATETYVTTAIGNISIPTNVSDLTNDAGYLTAHQDISGLAPKASPIFTGSISLGRKENTTVGGNSYAVGTNVEASADNAHAEGNSTRAAYVDSHAEGWGSEAISQAAHAEGRQGRATAFSAHAEGCQTTASGYASHSQGMGTQAKNKSQHVAGEYNVLDPSVNAAGLRGDYAEIIGNGTDNSNRSNARVLDWNGNERLAGDLYVGCDADSTGGSKVATETYVSTAISGIILPTKVSDLTNDSGFLTSVPTMTGATSSANGTAGLIPAPTSADAEKFFRGDGTWQDGGRPMVILSYGNSVWNDFITAYNNNVIVYCRASSNSNPATGSQTRMAFMAYVNNATKPTEVEFQYYRSMSAHSATAMGDEVYVYKLTSAGTWSVTVRKASIKEIAVASGSKLGVSWSSDKVTLSNTMTANDMPMSSSDATTTKAAIDTLSSNLSNKASKFLLVSSGEAVPNNDGITIPYPTGYSVNNTVVISKWSAVGNTKYYVAGASVAIEGAGIRFANSTGNAVVIKALIAMVDEVST